MQRRRFLAIVGGSGILIPGCLGRDGPGQATASATPRTVPSPTTDQPSSATPTPPPSPFPRHVAVEAVDDRPLRDAFDIAVDVVVPDGDVTAGETARVDVELRTTGGSHRSVTYEQRHCGRNEFRAETGGYALYLFPAGGGVDG